MYNNYFPNMPQPVFMPYHEIQHVNGETGALERACKMPPNSSDMFLDDNEPVTWLAQIDGSGHATVTPFTIEQQEAKKAPDMEELIRRIERLEGAMSHESNITDTPRKSKVSKSTEHAE